MKKNLISNLNFNSFAEIYVQTTICTLLFIRAIQGAPLSPENLSTMYSSHPILKSLIQNTFQPYNADLARVVLKEFGVVEIIELLKDCDFEAITRDFTNYRHEIDLITYFYELFLEVYDSQQKIRRGIFHTPNPVVNFMVKSTDYLLRTELDCSKGLTDAKVQILDPAVGTGTFLEFIIREIKSIFEKNNEDLDKEQLSLKWNDYVSKHLLEQLFGFELLSAPYSLAHLKVGFLLRETGYDFSTNQRLKLFLTNTLEAGVNSKSPSKLENISREDILAEDIKTSNHITVVIGNPPYSRSSKNTGTYIKNLMDSYKRAVRDEKNIQPLSDDYIKFIRISQEFIERAGWGIIGLITNHTYLTGIIHRGMREELMKVFDSIYILDLHGSKIIHENIPSGIKDENIFGIKQGVCIAFFLKNPKSKRKRIYHYDLFGTKEDKYEWLIKNNISTISWADLSNITPGAPFINPLDLPSDSEYQKFHSLTEIFEFYNVGGKPGDDNLLISFDQDEVADKLTDICEKIKMSKKIGKLTEAKQKLLRVIDDFSIDPSKFEKYNYRPLDIRWTYYDPQIWTRPVQQLKQQCQNNLMLLCSRIVKDAQFSHVFVSKLFIDVIYLSNTSSVNCYVFPLLRKFLNGEKNWNLTPLYLNYVNAMGLDVQNLESIEPLAYIYAILSSNQYRSRYSKFLKRDFPRIPFIKNQKLFTQLVKLGKELITIHQYPEDLERNPEITTNIKKNDKIERGFPKYNNKYIFINPNKWFFGIDKDEWEFKIGKYQVCHKWLKDRKDRTMSKEDIIYYLKIINLIKKTIKLTKKIDKIIEIT